MKIDELIQEVKRHVNAVVKGTILGLAAWFLIALTLSTIEVVILT